MEYDINLILNMKPIPPILSPPAKSMIKLSIQNVIPFLVQHLFPSRLKSIKEKGGLNPHRSLYVPVLRSERFVL